MKVKNECTNNYMIQKLKKQSQQNSQTVLNFFLGLFILFNLSLKHLKI